MGVTEVMRRALASISAYDRDFGPLRDDERDLTLLFEHTILTMIPTIFMIIAAPFYVRYYSRQPLYVERGVLYWLKAATSIVYIAIEVANVVLWSLSQYGAAFSVSAAALSLTSALAIAIMLSAEHRHALRPSAFVSLYVAIAIMLDVVKARSYFLRDGLQVIGGVSCASAAVKLMLLALGEKSKRSQVLDPELKKSLGNEVFSGFLNRSLFIWLNTTLFVGFRTIITVDDLDALGQEFSSKALSAKFKTCWAKADQARRYCLLKASILSLSSSFIIIWFPRLCFTVFYFAQPFLLSDIVSYFSRHDRSTDERDGLIAATIVIYTGLAVSRAWYEHATHRAIIFLRGMLIPEVFQKTLVLDHAKASDYSAMTLMSTDIDGIVEGSRMFVEITASFIETAVGIGILTTVTGAASFLVIIPSIITWIFSYRYAKRIPAARVAWNEGIEARVSATSHVFAQIKSIKMVGQVPQMVEYLQHEREREMELSRKYRTFSAVLTSTGLISYCLTPISVLAGALFWTTFKDGDSFNPVNVFTTLAIVGLVGLPLGHIMAGFPRLAGTVACFQRVQSYLRLQEKQEKRIIISNNPAKHLVPLALTEKEGDVWMPSETSNPAHSQKVVCPIEFMEASIAPNPDKVSVIPDASFRIARSQLTAVVGPTASGKSTLLKAMIGEAHITRGTIQLEHDSIAYCGQSAWLMNITVRENILGNSELDDEWYKTVLHVCCLQEDIQRLSKGDETLAGSGGLQLSGGQRQRIALARAIYSRAPVLLLDDVLSALDHTTAMAIVDRLFGPKGLLRRMKHTVIVTTHSETLARVADQILLIDNSGSVKSAGTPEDAGLGSSLTVEALRNLPFITNVEECETAPDETRLVEKEVKTGLDSYNRKMGDTSLYIMYFKPVMKRVIVVWLLASIMYSVSERAPEIYIRIWLDVDPSNKLYFIGYSILGIISGLFPMIMLSIFWNYLVPQTSKGLHQMLVNTAMSATLPFLTSTDLGYLINRFSQDMTLISQSLSEFLWSVTYDTLISVMDIGIIAAGSKYLAIAVPLILAIVYYIQLFYLRTSRQIRHLDLEKKTPLYTQFAEMATGIEHIRCFGWQKASLDKCHELLDESQRPAYAMFCVQRWLTLAMDMLTLVLATVLVVLAFHFNGVSQSGLGLALLNVTSFGKQLTGTVTQWTGLETALGALSRLQNFLKSTPVEKDKDDNPPALAESWPERGEVEFRNLSVGYSDNTPKVIRNFSLKIKSGQKVGIVGRTGSGKTTIFLTLLKFLNYNGSCIIDGHEVSDVPLAILRRRITTIPQDFIKYPGSIRDNLVPQDIMKEGSPSIQDSVLDEILGKVGAGVREEINLCGLDAPMESLGLSEGQKQLLTVARAIIHKRISGTKIVLIDEGTSSVDPETDGKIQALMNEFFQGSTVISISHRQETMQNADMVYSLDNVVAQ